MSNHHIFALYYPELFNKVGTITITDKALVDRMSKVLRLQINQTCILFNRIIYASFVITQITAKTITGTIKDIHNTIALKPYITLLLPLLKRDALETAIYGAVEAGVSEIQLVFTQKVQRKWGGHKELERLQRIVVAAAEQSKWYQFPEVHEPLTLEAVLNKYQDKKLFFADPEGTTIEKITSDCAILVGPEGDLTEQEKMVLQKYSVNFFKLTPTILRACQAAIISVALFRTI